MFHNLSIWLLVAAFAGAGLFNAIGSPATQESFIRWGYPRWWCRVTGAAEMVAAFLIALPPTRGIGMILGAAIIAAALWSVLRNRELSHLAPLGFFVALLAFAGLAL